MARRNDNAQFIPERISLKTQHKIESYILVCGLIILLDILLSSLFCALISFGWVFTIIINLVSVILIFVLFKKALFNNRQYIMTKMRKKLSDEEFSVLTRECVKYSVFGNTALTGKYLVSGNIVIPYDRITGIVLCTRTVITRHRRFHYNEITVQTESESKGQKKPSCDSYTISVPSRCDDTVIDNFTARLKDKCGGKLRVTGAFDAGVDLDN